MNSLRRFLTASIALVASLPAFGQVVYCTQTKPTSVPGCTAVLGVSDLTLGGSWVMSNLPLGPSEVTTKGIFIYTSGIGIGQSSFNVQVPPGTLCLQNFKRSSPACAFGVYNGSSNTCVGTISLPINCSAGALGLSVGDDVNVQGWYRDPPLVLASNFTDAIYYTIQ